MKEAKRDKLTTDKLTLDKRIESLDRLRSIFVACSDQKRSTRRWESREERDREFNKAKAAAERLRQDLEDARVEYLAAADGEAPFGWLSIKPVASVKRWYENFDYYLAVGHEGATTPRRLRAMVDEMSILRMRLRAADLALERGDSSAADCDSMPAAESEVVEGGAGSDQGQQGQQSRTAKTDDGKGQPPAKDKDGPIKPNGFAWKGQQFKGLQPTAWRLIRHLWREENRTAISTDLANDVWAGQPSKSAITSAVRTANKWFEKIEIPVSARTKTDGEEFLIFLDVPE